MNKRLKELFEQALEEFKAENKYATIIVPNPVKEKFAELIIGHATECVRDVLRDENTDLSYEAASQVQNRIKEYFGFEK